MDMAYRIVYGPKKKTLKTKKKWGILVAGCVLALVLLGRFLGWGEFLIPGDAAVTTMALDALIADLGSGAEIQEAFADFCREIMDHGALY